MPASGEAPGGRTDGTLGFPAVWSSGGDQELYDLGPDPREERNLADERADESRSLRSALLSWFATVRPAQGGGQKGQMDEKTKRELESLGYVQ